MLRRGRKQEIYPSNGKVEPLNQATIVFTDLALCCWTEVNWKRDKPREGGRERERVEWMRTHDCTHKYSKTIVHKTAYTINKITSQTIKGCCNSINISLSTWPWQDNSWRESGGLTFTEMRRWAGCFEITACVFWCRELLNPLLFFFVLHK